MQDMAIAIYSMVDSPTYNIPFPCPACYFFLFLFSPLKCSFLPLLGLPFCHFDTYLPYGSQCVEVPYIIYNFFCTYETILPSLKKVEKQYFSNGPSLCVLVT